MSYKPEGFPLERILARAKRRFGVQQMAQFFIPHAYEIYIDEETELPRKILMISTHLAEHSTERPIADARQEMVGAIATTVESQGLDGYAIKWGSIVESTIED